MALSLQVFNNLSERGQAPCRFFIELGEPTSTLDPQKLNLLLQFLRTTRIPNKQTQTQGHKLYSKVLAIEPHRLHKNSDTFLGEGGTLTTI